MKKLLLISAFFLFSFSQVVSQCMMKPVLLNQRVTQSFLVIEGKVIDQKSFWDPLHQNIYTSNLIEVYKTFKNTPSPYVEVITEGGIVGNDKEVVEPSLNLSLNDIGVFTINTNVLPSQFGKQVYECYASAQGFIKYNVTEDIATETFKTYASLSTSLYNEVQLATGSTFTVIKPYNAFYFPTSLAVSAPAALTSFSPTTITAGTFSVLTINGSGFGAVQGTSFVEFKNADDGGATYVKPDASAYVSWSATQILVKVPSTNSTSNASAGTGLIRVDVGGVKSTSATNLTIKYNHINVYSSTAPATIYNTRHINKQAGGYNWQMFTTFNSNALAKASFLRAFQTWRCGTYVNWTSTTTTTINVAANDGVNIIRFDVGAELPVGVLGRCTNRFSGCGVNPSQSWFVNELDIVFDDATTWNFGPAAPTLSQYDFESVAVHELGHGHELGHVINTLEIMNYSIANGQSKRVLSTNDLAGGNAVMARNASGTVCGLTMMAPLTVSNCVLGSPVASFSVSSTNKCIGQTIALTDGSTDTPTSWMWNMPGGAPSTSSTQNTSVVYSTAGVKTISLTSANSSGTSTAVMTVTVYAYPTVSVTTTSFLMCAGEIRVLNASGATSYSWSPSGSLSGSIGGVVIASPVVTTIYTITGTTGTCPSNSTFTLAVNPCTGLNDIVTTNQVIVFPNPSNGLFNIQVGDELEVNTVSVINQLGQVICVPNSINSNIVELDLSDFNNGIFYLKAYTSKGIMITKLVKNE
jgi:PKD repeat protein